jgi:hypothetical protein
MCICDTTCRTPWCGKPGCEMPAQQTRPEKGPATLQGLLDRCKCGVFLTVNEHRDLYQTAEYRLNEIRKWDEDGINDIPPAVLEKMIETDTIIELQFYPDTPIGSYKIYHYDLQLALEEAMSCFPPAKP